MILYFHQYFFGLYTIKNNIVKKKKLFLALPPNVTNGIFFDTICFSHFSNGFFLILLPMRGTSQSAPEPSLSLGKPSIVNKKIPTISKLVPKNTVSVIAFRITLTFDVKMVWFGCQEAVCVNKRHENATFGCSRFQMFNFDCFCLTP